MGEVEGSADGVETPVGARGADAAGFLAQEGDVWCAPSKQLLDFALGALVQFVREVAICLVGGGSGLPVFSKLTVMSTASVSAADSQSVIVLPFIGKSPGEMLAALVRDPGSGIPTSLREIELRTGATVIDDREVRIRCPSIGTSLGAAGRGYSSDLARSRVLQCCCE